MYAKGVVYVSSTFVDLEPYRAAGKLGLNGAGYNVESMERGALPGSTSGRSTSAVA